MKDHRELGRELELFFFDEMSPGSAFWLPRGMIIFKELEKLIRATIDERGYQEISTPIIVKSEVFKKSGHWEFFKDNMFNFKVDKEDYSVKPMNCPGSAIVFSSKTRSYKDLPLRLSEFGRLHRNELSGTLNGMFRVRQMVMDDAHVFCRMDQIQQEISDMLEITLDLYKRLKLPVSFGLATKPEKAMGAKEDWDEAEKQLENALKHHKINFKVLKGEGAFYGPKIHIDFTDSLKRTWTMATIQVDFQIPQGMDLNYVDEDGSNKRPVMLHRAILGSFERFVGILTEEYQGAFPLWLSPIQAKILPISDKITKYAKEVETKLKEKGLRAETDGRNETLQAKIRDGALQKIPYLLIVGAKEQESNKVAVRTRGGKDLGPIDLDEFTDNILKEVENKT